MHFLLTRNGARANADADSYQQQLDSILAVARRQELKSPAPERSPLPDDCPSTGDGFVWQAHAGVPEESNYVPPRTTNRLAHGYWRPILFMIIASLFIASHVGTRASNTPSRGLSTWP